MALTISPEIRAKLIIKSRYNIKFFMPSAIFSAPKLVIFVAGPVIMNAVALP